MKFLEVSQEVLKIFLKNFLRTKVTFHPLYVTQNKESLIDFFIKVLEPFSTYQSLNLRITTYQFIFTRKYEQFSQKCPLTQLQSLKC